MADEQEDTDLMAAVARQPMRRMVTLVCGSCHHEWEQPARTGCCPRCHAGNTSVVHERISALRTI